jgi:hypothetical protein
VCTSHCVQLAGQGLWETNRFRCGLLWFSKQRARRSDTYEGHHGGAGRENHNRKSNSETERQDGETHRSPFPSNDAPPLSPGPSSATSHALGTHLVHCAGDLGGVFCPCPSWSHLRWVLGACSPGTCSTSALCFPLTQALGTEFVLRLSQKLSKYGPLVFLAIKLPQKPKSFLIFFLPARSKCQ